MTLDTKMDRKKLHDALYEATSDYRKALIGIIRDQELRAHEASFVAKILEKYFPQLLSELRCYGRSDEDIVSDFATRMRETEPGA